jgi:hypothetical protein
MPMTLAQANYAFASKHRHAAIKAEPKQVEQTEQTEEDNSAEMQQSNQAEPSQDQNAESNQSSSSEEDRSTLSRLGSGSALEHMIDSRFRPPVTPGGVSLFNVFSNMAMIMLLVALIGCVPIAGTVLLCALVWHVGKMMRGGKKPAVG